MKNPNIILLGIVSILMLVGVNASEVGHPAEEIGAGTFDAGDFTFQGNVNLRLDNEVFLSLGNIEAGAGEWRLVSTGSDGNLGGTGNFAIYDVDGDVKRFSIDKNGFVEITRSIKLGADDSECESSKEGALRYNPTDKIMEFCDGTEWKGLGGGGVTEVEADVTINEDIMNYDLASDLSSKGLLSGAKEYVVLVEQGIVVGSTSTDSVAFTTGNLPSGATVKIINKGKIQGAGGAGGVCGSPGGNGGDAIHLTVDIFIDNGLGLIWSGGGGGGNGRYTIQSCSGTTTGAGGGGGAGSIPGEKGSGACSTGEAGTSSSGGTGGYCTVEVTCDGYFAALSYSAPTGGDGGSPGENGGGGRPPSSGDNDCSGVYNPKYSAPGYPGGKAGIAVVTNGNSLTWIRGNLDAQLRGAVE